MFPARRRDRPAESQQSPRAAWYDRSPSDQTQYYYGTGIAPHALTQRWTYTVPSGRKAWIDWTNFLAWRQVAASSLGYVYVFIEYTPSGGTTKYLLVLFHYNNTVGAKETVSLTPACLLRAGDNIKGQTYDGGTGGQMEYYLLAKITQFDA